MKSSGLLITFLIALLMGHSIPAFAMDKKQEREFHRISVMPLDGLTELAQTALKKRYPDEKWEIYRFPDYVFRNDVGGGSLQDRGKEAGAAGKDPLLLPL